ncbi:MAG: hypothetical protein E6Q46_00350 [Flavobacterium sp.]|jgi:hypothetical protein|nr:MAG: hypothetical protein E6Q46_00350 [Flavobacterium sp.]
MESYIATGRTKTDEQKITKSIASLIICSTKTVDELTNENITVWIERVNGSNVYLAQSVKLSDFLMLTNFGSDAIQSDATYKTIALCELSSDGAVQLNEGESLKYKIDSLISTHTYAVYTVEDPVNTLELFLFDRKTIGSEELQKSLDVRNADLCVIDMHPSIKEISFKYENGMQVKFLPFELRTIARDIDPVFSINQNASVSQGHSQKVCLPLVAVNSIEFVKDTGAVIEITTRKAGNLLTIE